MEMMEIEEFIKEKGKVGCCYEKYDHDIEDIIREAYELGKTNGRKKDVTRC